MAENSVSGAESLAQVDDEIRHPSFYKPGSGNILSFFAAAESAGLVFEPFPVPASLNFVTPTTSIDATDAPAETAEAAAESQAPTEAAEAEINAEPAPPVVDEAAASVAEAGACVGEEQPAAEDHKASSPQPAFQFKSHAVRRASTSAGEKGVKTRRQLLAEYQQQKKGGPRRQQRRHSTTTVAAAPKPAVARRALQPVLTRRSGDTGRAAKAPRVGEGHCTDDKENLHNQQQQGRELLPAWKKPQQAGSSTMFSMQFSPPSKKPAAATTVHAKAGSNENAAPNNNSSTGAGVMFPMIFSPPAKPGRRRQQKRPQPEDAEEEEAAPTEALASLNLDEGSSHYQQQSHLTDEMQQEGGEQASADHQAASAVVPTEHEAPESAVEHGGRHTPTDSSNSNAEGSLSSPARADPTSDEKCGTTPGGSSAPLVPPSPSKLQLLETLDELIEKEKEVKLLAEQLLRTEEDAVRWEEAALAAEEHAKELEKAVEDTSAKLAEREAELVKVKHQLDVTLQQLAELELQATQAKVGGAASLSEAQLSLLNASQERLLEVEKLLLQAQTRAEEERQRLEAELAGERQAKRAMEEVLTPAMRAMGLATGEGGGRALLSAIEERGSLREERDRAVRDSEAKAKVVEGLEAKVPVLEQKLRQAEDQARTHMAECSVRSSVLEQRVQDLQASMDEQATQRRRAEEKTEALARDKKQLEEEVLRLQREAERRQLHADQAEGRTKQLEEEVLRLQREAEKRQLHTDQAEGRTKQLEEEVLRLQREAERRELHADQAEDQAKQLEEEVLRLQREAERRQQHADQAEDQAKQLEEEVLRLQREAERRQLHTDQAEGQAAKAVHRIKELEHQAQQSLAAKEEACKQLEQSERRKAQLAKEVEALGVKLATAKDQAKKLEKELEVGTSKLRQDVSTLRDDLNRRKESERAVDDQRRRMVDIMKGLEDQLKAITTELHEEQRLRQAMEEHVHTQQAEISTLQAENSSLMCKVEEYRQQARHLENMHTEMGVRMGRLEDDCERKDQLRKTLHNQVMELKGNIRVFVRVRPPLPSEPPLLPFEFVDSGVGTTSDDCQTIEVTEPQSYRGGLSERRRRWRFTYDQVFGPRASQESVFAEVSPLVQSALDGYRACIFAYGQTGSGKTFTMMGPEADPSGPLRGVVYRAVEQIFSSMDHLAQHGWAFRLSMELVEIYNESIRDLLSFDSQQQQLSSSQGSTGSNGSRGLEIRQHAAAREGDEEQTVPGLTSVEVRGAEEVTSLVSRAMARRCTKSTRVNADSSRSHCLLTLRIEGSSERGQVRRGCLHLVDLAGSERLSKSGSNEDPALLREAQAINKSLSVLGNVISALYRKERHVPFRESTLTRLLRPSLGGDCKALMFCNLSPCTTHLHESMCSLRFAQKVNACTTAATSN